MAEIVIQDCGCIAIPEELVVALGMLPGTRLELAVDADSRSIILTVPPDAIAGKTPVLAACLIK